MSKKFLARKTGKHLKQQPQKSLLDAKFRYELMDVPRVCPRLTRSAWSFLEAYKPKSFTVVNMALKTELRVEGIKVRFITCYELPKWLSAIFD